MVTLCQHCHTVLKVDLMATYGLSHGLCEDCMPGYLRQNGVPEEEIKKMMKKERKGDRE